MRYEIDYIVETVENVTKITQDRSVKENKPSGEILNEELRKVKEKEGKNCER